MPKIIFPKSWLSNVEDFDQLASKLSLQVDYLLDLEKKIPSCYHEKIITAKGKSRKLSVPIQKLKSIQRKILDNLLNFQFPEFVHGGVPGRSILTNAKNHLAQRWVMCLDIRDFFPTIHFEKIYNNFLLLKYSPKIAKLLTHFTTYEYELPQGAPASPAIANMVLYNLDKRISNLCKIKGFKYSRYFDDVTISGYRNPKSILKKCESITNQEGFKINKTHGKLRIVPHTKEQVVTGILVNNKKLRIPSNKIKEIQNLLDKLISGDFSVFINKDAVKIKAIIEGSLAFLKSVNPQIGKNLEKKFLKIDWNSFCS